MPGKIKMIAVESSQFQPADGSTGIVSRKLYVLTHDDIILRYDGLGGGWNRIDDIPEELFENPPTYPSTESL